MIAISIILDGDNAWPDLRDKSIIHLKHGSMAVAALDGGMSSGRPSVAMRFDLPDGQTVVAETSARLFVSAGRAIDAKFPDLFKDN